MEELVQSRTTFRWIRWFALIVLLLAVIVGVDFTLTPKPLVVKGALKTAEGPVAAGQYDFRLKFYNASTRTDLVYSHDLQNVLVEGGSFDITLPGDSLKVATLMQVCIASPSKPSADSNKATIASCETSDQTNTTAFNQTICGLTTVDHNPTNLTAWLSDKNIVFTAPSKGCGDKDGNAASITSKDIITPLLEEPGTLSELLGGVRLQSGTVLAVSEDGQLEAIAPTNLLKDEIDKIKEQQTEEQTTEPTTIVQTGEGEQNTDNQMLSLSGNILSISGGNSVSLPSTGPEGDAIIGNEITDTIANSGLVRVGSGTMLDPYKIALESCANGEVLKSSGSGAWACAADSGGASYTAGSGLQLIGAQFSINSPTCAGTTKLQWNGSAFVCSADVDTNTTYSAGTGLSLIGTTFSNTGVLGVSGSGAITSTGGQNPNIAFANGAVSGQFWQWDGDSWELATLAAESDSVIGNEVTNVTGVNSGLTRSGAGTAIDPYTLAVSVGNGIQLTSGNVAINSPTCSGTDKLQWTGTAFVCSADVDTDTNTTYTAGNGLQLIGTAFSVNSPTCAGTTKLQWDGSAFICSADVDTNTDAQTLSWVDGTRTLSISNGNSVVIPDTNTTYSTISNGGLRLVGTQFGLSVCTSGEILKAQATSGEYACAADNDTDTNTTYSAGTGLSLVGTTFNNTGVLGVTGTGAITSTGSQNPAIAFANGSVSGQFWQWDGDSWELATLAAESDGVIGNEVTNVTGSNSGLARSGAGTAVDPYTLAVSVGSGLQLLGGNVAINSPTCAGTTKLQWTGSAFVCSADVDTDTTNFSIADGSTSQSVSAAQAITFLGNSTTKTTVTLGGTRQLTFGLDTTGAGSGQVLTFTGAALAWQTPTTYAPTTCSISGTYFCQGGNTYGATATLGTNDAQSLVFETSNTTQMTILANGNVGIGVSPSEKLDVNGSINIPTTTSSVGVIKQNGARWLHSYGGITNFFAGSSSGNFTSTGTENVGIGQNVFQGNTSGSFNVATGNNALDSNTTGGNNVGMGWSALTANTTGSNNTATGTNALQANLTSNYNSAFGAGGLQSTTGTANTAVGNNSLNLNVGGNNNVAIGYSAGVSNTSANANTSGSNNTYIGFEAGLGSTTQRDNSTAIGFRSVVNQSDSLVLGCIAGTNGCGTSTKVGITNSAPGFLLHVGSSGVTSGTSVARFENAGGTCTVTPNTAGGITCTSDKRLKKNFEAYAGALQIINQIEVKKYNMLTDTPEKQKQIGVIAQQLEAVLPSLVETDQSGYKSVSYAGLAPVLLQAIKEQQVQIDTIKQGIWTGGVVTKDTTFKAAATFNGPVKFSQNTTFDGDLEVVGKIKLSGDQVNMAVVQAGQRRVIIRFKGSYETTPYITATPRDFVGDYRITEVKKTGFVIELSTPQKKATRFDWHAFGR